jgi:hypothetical protein
MTSTTTGGTTMRRILGSGLLLLALSATTLPAHAVPMAADQHSARTAAQSAHPSQQARQADQALAQARDALTGGGGDATLALTALRAAYPHLSASEKQRADAIFARPTDGLPGPGNPGDPYGDGYDYAGINGEPAVDAAPLCGVHVCVHYVTGSDAAPDTTDTTPADGIPDWVQLTLDTMESVWTYEVDTRGYRAPASDETATNNGGDGRLDVYLANVSGAGLYGYCAPEKRVQGERFRYSGYCVLDDDYVGFPTPPEGSLKVTAAHEFFHTIQFNYDALEDHWIMEATATWMEERFADAVNDNRFYLADSQMHVPSVPLDKFGQACCQQYGNWIFFERLSQKYGVDAVRTLWQRMDTAKGKPDDYSVLALKTFLAHKKTTFAKFYTTFAAGNLFPQKVYSEGSHYGMFKAPVTMTWKFTPHLRSVTGKKASLKHLTSADYAFKPSPTMTGTWFLTIKVDGPGTAAGSGAQAIIVSKSGAISNRPVKLNSNGVGKVRVPFGAGKVKLITLTLANGSTNYNRCYTRQTEWSCDGGIPDPSRTFRFSAVASR